MKKILLTKLSIMMTMIANAQATKASDDAFAGAMIRNVLIIGGIVVVFYVIKSFNKKND